MYHNNFLARKIYLFKSFSYCYFSYPAHKVSALVNRVIANSNFYSFIYILPIYASIRPPKR